MVVYVYMGAYFFRGHETGPVSSSSLMPVSCQFHVSVLWVSFMGQFHGSVSWVSFMGQFHASFMGQLHAQFHGLVKQIRHPKNQAQHKALDRL